jgi:riboflavin synthase
MPETLKRSSFGQQIPGIVNLERPLKLNDRLDGHIVQGHVDTVGKVKTIKPGQNNLVVTISFDPSFNSLVVAKGSICIDGTSLTVVDCGNDWLSVSLVEYTLKHTTLGNKKNGDLVNIEFDILGKYILKMKE